VFLNAQVVQGDLMVVMAVLDRDSSVAEEVLQQQ